MEFNYKKISLLIGFVIICVLIGYGIYLLFFKPTSVAKPTTGDTTVSEGEFPTSNEGSSSESINQAGGGLPKETTNPTEPGTLITPLADTIAKGGVTQTTKISDAASFAPTLSQDGSSLYYYNQTDGKFYQLNNDGTATLLSDKTFYNVQNVNWAPNKQKVIIEYPDGANILYNFETQKQITLPKHWQEFDFSPQSDQIVAKSMGVDPENRWLIISNDDGSKAQAIENLGTEGDRVFSSWSPNNLSIALFTESLDFNRQKIYFVGKNHENFKATTVEGRGIDFQWTPSGDRLLYSVYNDQNNLKPELWIVNGAGDEIGSNRQRLDLQTWASKCTIANEDTVYCAVPKSLPEGAGLFPQLANESTDNIYKINLNNGSKQLIAVPNQEYNINNIIVSQSEKYLYFTDSATNNIHKINLK